MLVGLPTAQAADTTLTLACKGTKTHQGGAGTSSEAINIGLIVDFQKKTIVGFRESDKLKIVDSISTETTIGFVGAGTLRGTLDRVTDTLVATLTTDDLFSWDLQCTPTQSSRMVARSRRRCR
jgi:hypothetical protein